MYGTSTHSDDRSVASTKYTPDNVYNAQCATRTSRSKMDSVREDEGEAKRRLPVGIPTYVYLRRTIHDARTRRRKEGIESAGRECKRVPAQCCRVHTMSKAEL